MIKTGTKIIVVFLMLSCLTHCASQKSNAQDPGFEYRNGNESIIFEIATGEQYLQKNVATETKFKFEHIDKNTVSLSGKAIRFLKQSETEQNELLIQMAPEDKDLNNGKLEISLGYPSNGEYKMFKISIPVK